MSDPLPLSYSEEPPHLFNGIPFSIFWIAFTVVIPMSNTELRGVNLLVSSKKQKKINFFYQWGTFSKIPHVTSL